MVGGKGGFLFLGSLKGRQLLFLIDWRGGEKKGVFSRREVNIGARKDTVHPKREMLSIRGNGGERILLSHKQEKKKEEIFPGIISYTSSPMRRGGGGCLGQPRGGEEEKTLFPNPSDLQKSQNTPHEEEKGNSHTHPQGKNPFITVSYQPGGGGGRRKQAVPLSHS